jgi:hypothetical protein
MTGVVRGGRLPSDCAEAALRPRGPAHRRSDARARPAPVAAAQSRAADVPPPADPACRHSCASRRGPCRSPRRVARRRAARADPRVLILKPGSTAASIRQTDASRLTGGVGFGWPIAHACGRMRKWRLRTHSRSRVSPNFDVAALLGWNQPPVSHGGWRRGGCR